MVFYFEGVAFLSTFLSALIADQVLVEALYKLSTSRFIIEFG